MLGDDSERVEGFICPICKSNEKNGEKLLQHFEENHSEDRDLVKSAFRDVFKIAKKKILNLDENELSRTFENTKRSLQNSNLYQGPFIENKPQGIGSLTDHIEYFKAVRNPRLERYATETNKLIIRLNKLLTDRPTDPQQIKQHEQSVSLLL